MMSIPGALSVLRPSHPERVLLAPAAGSAEDTGSSHEQDVALGSGDLHRFHLRVLGDVRLRAYHRPVTPIDAPHPALMHI